MPVKNTYGERIAREDLIVEGNPRTRPTTAELKKLADMIKQFGVTSLVVAPAEGTNKYHIIDGMRRYLATSPEIFGKTAPTHFDCDVWKGMSEGELNALRVVLNVDREPLPLLDEAQYLQKMVSETGSVPAVAAMLKKTPAYVAMRVAVAQRLTKPWKDLLAAGQLENKAALLVATLGEPEQQELLEQVKYRGQHHINATHQRLTSMIKEMLEGQSMKGVPWDLKEVLELDKNKMICDGCSYRSKGNTDLFGDITSKDTCANAKCYNAKTAHWVQVQIKKFKAEKIQFAVSGSSSQMAKLSKLDKSAPIVREYDWEHAKPGVKGKNPIQIIHLPYGQPPTVVTGYLQSDIEPDGSSKADQKRKKLLSQKRSKDLAAKMKKAGEAFVAFHAKAPRKTVPPAKVLLSIMTGHISHDECRVLCKLMKWEPPVKKSIGPHFYRDFRGMVERKCKAMNVAEATAMLWMWDLVPMNPEDAAAIARRRALTRGLK